MSEVLTEIGGMKLTVTMAASVFSVLIALLLMIWWIEDRKKTTGKPLHAGMLMNGIGFGFFPGIAVWTAFEVFSAGVDGRPVMEPLPLVSWLSEAGRFAPCRIELAAALVSFIGISLWMILRKKPLPDNGDLLLTCICLWALIRLITESLRDEPRDIFRYASCGAMDFCMMAWTLRRGRKRFAWIRIAADLFAAAVCTVMIILTMKGILSSGSEVADLAVISGCGLLIMILALLAGSDYRQMNPETENSVSNDTIRIPGPCA